MGKIVKYCSDCEESFAEKFAYCPNCANQLTTFEMNPVKEDAPKSETVGDRSKIAATSAMTDNFDDDEILDSNHFDADSAADDILEITPAEDENSFAEEPVLANENNLSADTLDTNFNSKIIENENIADEKPETVEPETVPVAASAAVGSFANANGRKSFSGNIVDSSKYTDDGFNVTVIEEKNAKQRYGLLLGSMAIILSIAFGSFIYSLFNYDALVGSIGSDPTLLALIDEVPMQLEKEEPPKPDEKEKDGGGGGSGKNETKPASRGQLPTQTDKPTFPPSVTIPKISNPVLPVEVSTQGKIKRKTTDERYGLPDSLSDDLSNGPGSGGGIGRGRGSGVGGGIGTGEGNGTGSGSGNGTGNGTGDGTGDGNGRRSRTVAEAKPAEPAGPSKKFNITSKPRADYTDEAREKQITGIVSLRVTLNANGSVGSISPINSLPYGLTEKAIAAARQLKFEPQLKNGVPQTVRVQIQYNFTIY